MPAPLSLHPHRALPADPAVRDIAVRIYEQTAHLPLVCMHGHVDVDTFVRDEPFAGIVSPEISRDAQEILEAGLRSMAEGREVSLPLTAFLA